MNNASETSSLREERLRRLGFDNPGNERRRRQLATNRRFGNGGAAKVESRSRVHRSSMSRGSKGFPYQVTICS